MGPYGWGAEAMHFYMGPYGWGAEAMHFYMGPDGWGAEAMHFKFSELAENIENAINVLTEIYFIHRCNKTTTYWTTSVIEVIFAARAYATMVTRHALKRRIIT